MEYNGADRELDQPDLPDRRQIPGSGRLPPVTEGIEA